MDIALLKKIDVYPTDSQVGGLITDEETGLSTLIKADVSLFHQPPAQIEPPSAETVFLSDYETGFKEGQEKAEDIYKDTIGVMESALAEFQTELSSIISQIEESHLSAVSACLRAVFPTLMRGGMDVELQAILNDACQKAVQGTILIKAHPDEQAHITMLCRAYPEDIAIETDVELRSQQIKIEWASGGAEIDCASMVQTCLKHLESTLQNFNRSNVEDNTHE